MKIDVHSHFYPAAYLDELRRGGAAASVEVRPNGDYVVRYEGDYNIVTPKQRDLKERLQVLDAAGIDRQVLSLMTPGVQLESEDRGVYLAELVNEAFAAICAAYPGRFLALAALPLQKPEAAAAELERAVSKLGLSGGLLFTNVRGKTLDDPSFACVLQTARRLDVPLLIHPMTPQPADAYRDYRLVATLGFPFDTTISVARLIFGGVLDRVEGVKIIVPHLGGCLPYLAERLDRGHSVFAECRGIRRKPSEYIKDLYFDCVHFDPAVVAFVAAYMGPRQIMLGSDYPAQVGDIAKCARIVDELGLDEREKELISAGNARRLFRVREAESS